MEVKMKQVGHGIGLDLPSYQTEGAAGVDLFAAISDQMTVEPGERFLFPTGLQMEIPAGFEGQVRPRSGLALKKGVTVLNTPGTVDSDYRGEVGVILINQSDVPVTILRGERIAQMVFAPVTKATITKTDATSSTSRGEGGFGSTDAPKTSETTGKQ